MTQGSEAGGHRGSFAAAFEASMIGTMALVPQVVDAVRIPVIASGGIMDGRGLAAALALGAGAAQLGTAFLTCDEAGVPEAYKAAILARASAGDAADPRLFRPAGARHRQPLHGRDRSRSRRDPAFPAAERTDAPVAQRGGRSRQDGISVALGRARPAPCAPPDSRGTGGAPGGGGGNRAAAARFANPRSAPASPRARRARPSAALPAASCRRRQSGRRGS